MADGFYSGIMRPRQGSRPIDASIIGQERMQRRKIESDRQDQERAQQEALRKEVMKSLDINPQFSNNFFNMDFNSDISDVVTNVVEMYAKGDPYAANYGMTQARRLKNKANTLKTFDQNWEEARASIDAAHSEGNGHLIDNMWEYRGKTYNNVIEVFNDPSLYGDPQAYEDAMQHFEGADPITKIQKQPQQLVDQGAPEYIAYFDSPKLGAIVNPAQGIASMLKSSEASQFYTEERDPFKMNLNGVNIEVQKLGIPFQQGMRMIQSEYSKPSALNYVSSAAMRDYMAANPDNPRSRQEFWQKFNTDKTFRDNAIKTYGIDEGMRIVESAAIRGEKVTSRPAAAKPTSAQKFAETHFGGSTYTRDGNELRKTLPATDQVERWFLVPDGSTFFTGTGEGERSQRGTVKTKDGVRLKVSPQEVVWNTKDLSKSRIVLLSNMDENMRESSKRTYTYEVPLDAQTFGRLAEMFKTTKEDAMGILLRDADAGAVGDIKKWAKSLGMDASQIPGPGTGQSSTPASGSSNTDKYAKYGATKR